MIKNKIIYLSFLLLSTKTFAVQYDVLNNINPIEFKHENRISLMYGMNPSFKKATELTNFALSYSEKKQEFWWDSNLLITNGLFNRVALNNASATGVSETQLAEQSNRLVSVGFGLGRETRYTQTLLPFENLFEMMSANLTYNFYNEGLSNKSFTGPGILAKVSVYKMLNEYFSVGTHLNYSLSVVKRAQEIENETSSARSLTMSFVTFGFDLSLFL